MSSRIFQSVIIQIKEATDRCIGIIDDQGFVITCSELPMIGSRLDDFSSMSYDFSEPVLVSGVRTYKVLSNNSSKFDYAVFVEGCDDMAVPVLKCEFEKDKEFADVGYRLAPDFLYQLVALLVRDEA